MPLAEPTRIVDIVPGIDEHVIPMLKGQECLLVVYALKNSQAEYVEYGRHDYPAATAVWKHSLGYRTLAKTTMPSNNGLNGKTSKVRILRRNFKTNRETIRI